MASNLTAAIVHNEGCDLHYWYTGQGPLIVFIPGGNGHGRQFFPIMAALADKYTCATFDRRQMSASKVPVNKKLNPPQQARDIRTIIQTLGFEKSILFGSSLGGLLAFQFAHDFPDMVDHLISHEAGTAMLLPDASVVVEWFLHLMEVYETQGLEQAANEFGEKLIGYDAPGLPPPMKPEPWNQINFWDNEFPILVGYMPNFWRIKNNGTSIGVMRGVRCKDAFFARTVDEQAKVLDCPKMTVPGHHEGFQVELEAFLPFFFEMLITLEKKRNAV